MHKIALTSLALALALVATAGLAHADEELRQAIREEIAAHEAESKTATTEDPKALKAYWDNGLKFKGKNFKAQIGGRIMLDVDFIDDKDYVAASGRANSPTSVEFRRLRFFTSGQIGKTVGYKIDFDFTSNSIFVKDAWIEFRGLRDCFGCGTPVIQIGRMKEPIGLEWMTSSKYLTFIERSIMTEAFSPDRGTGIMIKDVWRGGQMGYQAGVFTSESALTNGASRVDGNANFETHGWGATGRYWWAPWYDCNCKSRRLHVGASASYRTDIGSGSRVRYRSRPGVHTFSHRAINTDRLAADSTLTYGAELAWVLGPWSIQAEYMGTQVSAPTGGTDSSFYGYYAEVSYWLTGESRVYKNGVFGRTKPCCNWLDQDCCCKGGWQLAARYNFVDLNDGAVTGGEMTTIEFGVNWHLSPTTRIMWNVVYANVDRSAGQIAGAPASNGLAFDEDILAFATRFQVDF